MSSERRGARILVTAAVTSFAAVLALGGLFATSDAAEPSSVEVWIRNASDLGIPGAAGVQTICVRQPPAPWRIAVDDPDAWEEKPAGVLCAKAGAGSARHAQIRLERTK